MGVIDTIIKKINEINLNRMQKANDKLYEKDGLTDEVLDNQIEINTKRNALDILDKNELTESNKGFVQ